PFDTGVYCRSPVTKLLFVSLFLSSLFSGCVSGVKSDKKREFENTAKCASYWNVNTDELYGESANIVVGELFYSPKLNTCALSYRSYWHDREPVVTYVINDVLTHSRLFSKDTLDDPKAKEAWEAKVAELKADR